MATSYNEMMKSFSDDEIIQRCKEATPDLLLSSVPYGGKVVKLTDQLAVKCGWLLGKDEAGNQAKAYEMLDPSIVRVPRVHRYFMDSKEHGYIVMDLMEGVIKDSIAEGPDQAAMSRILEHFASFKSQKPGPLTGGGPSRGFLFGDADHPTFESVQDMEAWFNVRLLDPKTEISFKGLELVFCHLDLFPRNIFWLDNHPPCVLDWTSAGFYPRIFERCSQLITQQPETNPVILDQSISQFEAVQVDLVHKAWWNNIKFSL
ncbi:hypothetical protein A1O3_06175 [Capronia epimyces CBS 606.96]|uniref:Aminoglycoside phosphotransferase domain-containing protein n=1 Tax=Capronia epimyces CBS 606.96 TaxID=1182542 RepID=W9XPC6_9EURO|nr:uncharacterized protein A1O3_06175 [Capronia epimyces CBS 606.96]EXJ82362.1 hypothetical protein A1O3_06175 [Capronia epimyces CBS 606.96]